jgi:3-hydroxyacyl-[acyl-carrier-protein] dehydratase
LPAGRPGAKIRPLEHGFEVGSLPQGESLRVGKELLLDHSEIDLDRVVADLEEIRRFNPQRFEMEQLSAICFDDAERMVCAGYKDITPNEFWVRGHMPGMPLMPGVLICEAAAQMCSYFAHKHHLLGDCKVVGFGGLEDVHFRDPVRVGDRLVIVCKMIRVRLGAIIVCRFQAFVRQSMVADGKIKGIPLPVDALTAK